jgi:hypothetical protein
MIGLEMRGQLSVTDAEGNTQKVIIQRVKAGLGNGRIIGDRQVQVRRHPGKVKDPITHAQVARRSRFQDAVSAWQGMSKEERAPWVRRARKASRTGYNLFISEWMRSHP